MEDLLKPFVNLAKEPTWRIAVEVIDVLVVAWINYRILALIRGTRAWRICFAILVFVLLLLLSSALHLDTMHWLLATAAPLAPVALAILLLPELRQALEYFGRFGIWTEKLVARDNGHNVETQTIEEVVAAAAEMSASRVGALIVLEQSTPLSDIIANGVQLDAKLSPALLGSIFYTGNPLHDGAAIIRGGMVVAAACRLPLSETSKLDSTYHMRHRAAIGLTEQLDAIVVVVSEERGSISVASEGKITRLPGPAELREILKQKTRPGQPQKRNGERRRVFAKARLKDKKA